MAGDSADRILTLLKTDGEQTAGALARRLGVTMEAVRQQLGRLEGQGLVRHVDHRTGVGRPARHWRLSEQGHARFPDRHAMLTLEMIEAVRRLFGADDLERLIADRETSARRSYGSHMAACTTLREKVAALAEIREAEGYMASWQEAEGGYLLVENHCPICAAARLCQGFCRSELALFQSVLGPAVEVTRTDHLLAGARRCAYLIRPRPATDAKSSSPTTTVEQ